MDGAQIVFHAAAYNPANSTAIGAQVRAAQDEIDRVLDAFARSNCARLVHTGSSCVFWPNEIRVRSALAQVKHATAERIREAAGRRRLDIVTLIPTHCIGERDAKVVSGGLVCALVKRRMPAATTGIISPVDVRAVAQAHIDFARSAPPGSVRVVRGPDMRVSDYVRLAAEALGAPAPHVVLPPDALYPLAYLSEYVARAFGLRAPLTVETLDLVKHTFAIPGEQISTEADIRDAVRRTAAWYRAHAYLPPA
jgi:dihydroflavonol-4-reductase